jgi:hypothetical protein
MKKLNPANIGIGIIILIVAAVLLADLIGFLKANDIFGAYWPALLILVGIVVSTSPGGSGKIGLSLGLMMLGLLLILRTTGVLASQAGETILVVILALTAIVVLVMSVGGGTKPANKKQDLDN